MLDNLNSIQDLIIIGSGPAGYTAGIYAKRAGLNPVIIQGLQPGGQLTQTTSVDNYPGFKSILGPDLMSQMEEQALDLGVKMIFDTIESVDFSNKPFKLIGKSQYLANSIIIATGSNPKNLGIKGEKMFTGFGVSWCATCDGFFFKNQEVAVIGGGNTAVEEAIYLAELASKVYLIHRRDKLRAEKILQDKLFSLPNVEVIWNTEVIEIIGQEIPQKSITEVVLLDNTTKNINNLKLSGIFIAIGYIPNTNFLNKSLDLDEDNYLITNNTKVHKNGKILQGIYAAGDVQDKIYRQAITSAGSGCIAALNVISYINSLK